MFCPNCGLPQAASETRFCSKCGFQLGGVIHLLSTGGKLPALPAGANAPRALSPRHKGIRIGAFMMLLTMLVVPLVAVITGVTGFHPDLLIPLAAIGLFIGGLLRIIYALMLEEAGPQNFIEGTAAPSAYVPPFMQQSIVGNQRPELGAANNEAVPGWRRPHNTADMVDRPSVTEHTTRLLTQDPEGK